MIIRSGVLVPDDNKQCNPVGNCPTTLPLTNPPYFTSSYILANKLISDRSLARGVINRGVPVTVCNYSTWKDNGILTLKLTSTHVDPVPPPPPDKPHLIGFTGTLTTSYQNFCLAAAFGATECGSFESTSTPFSGTFDPKTGVVTAVSVTATAGKANASFTLNSDGTGTLSGVGGNVTTGAPIEKKGDIYIFEPGFGEAFEFEDAILGPCIACAVSKHSSVTFVI